MKLFYSATSPYVRKVVACAITREIDSQIERIPSGAASAEALAQANPLGKVPTLLTPDGVALFDSPVICEYLDTVGDAPPLFPDHGAHRWLALKYQALGDGIMDAAVMTRGEVLRPAEEARQKNMDHQKLAITRSLTLLEAHLPSSGTPDIGAISVACALGYLDFRFADDGWRGQFPRLLQWFESISALPGLATTIPPG
ncbi:glutathione S-transferase N-terminal domain-containing protein [Acidisoma cladoniae]|jgi:glutathione S-transferase|uniref:glutathione S-transferase N-terminal domain-containing protein n=1 Tax=Acidisoma cladoniae TaxID=3040935 RepID=UPI00254D238E|nr:glutathione S-transferase N-terminal domain-containing protein [Acidisoma sp. PAMC 29798]